MLRDFEGIEGIEGIDMIEGIDLIEGVSRGDCWKVCIFAVEKRRYGNS